jgi:hypothetical protein
MAPLVNVVIAAIIACAFLIPALFRPTLGRIVLSTMFLGGGLFNLLSTLPNTPGSLEALVASAPVPPYREVVSAAIGWNVAPALVVVTIVFEISAGLAMLWRGSLVRVALVAAGAWGLGMLPLIPPDGVLIGAALTGGPGAAGLLLARHSYRRSVCPEMAGAVRGFRVTTVLRRLVQPIPALLIFAALWGVFVSLLHPWFMNWGSTPEEQAMVLPGDAAAPSAYFTRAITVDAPPSAVWPWLLAIGQDRAGFLSNDYLENLTGADIHNADTLRPEWQQRAIGDRVPMASPGMRALGGDVTSTTIHTLEPERVIADTPGRFVLLPRANGATRLLLRESLDDPIRAGAAWIIWDPMHFVMEQRMLQGVKERAEGKPLVPALIQAAAQLGWISAGLGLFALFAVRRGWGPWIILPIGLMLPSLLLTGDVNSVLAGFLAIGITLSGFLAFGWRWLPPYLLVGSGVALVMLIAPDSHATFGWIFLLLAAATVGAFRHQVLELVSLDSRHPAPYGLPLR